MTTFFDAVFTRKDVISLRFIKYISFLQFLSALKKRKIQIPSFFKSKKFFAIIFFCICLFSFYIYSSSLSEDLLQNYKNKESALITDRHGEVIALLPNPDGYYARYSDSIPEDFQNLLLQKEDSYFFWHLGFNPVSILEALWDELIGTQRRASSTITQQLAKILLGNEQERTIQNKIKETIAAVSLELHLTKEEILEMYVNSIYLGNHVQGLNMASKLYFDRSPRMLIEEENIKLLATISSPSVTHPFSLKNAETSQKLAKRLGVEEEIISISNENQKKLQEKFQEYVQSDHLFELQDLTKCTQKCQLNIDSETTTSIREILEESLSFLEEKKATHGSVVVIKYPENELLALVGSKNPEGENSGDQINMALQMRPIGSTIKPLLYTKGFETGLRPYSLVDDREYKYEIESGFAFYPKNYDYEYNGIVNLHYSLSNSLNIPTVKVLEYIGLPEFYTFLGEDLEFTPLQNFEEYQLGIGLGHLEMSLLQLTHYFTLFAHEGTLKPLTLNGSTPVDILPQNQKQIFPPALVQLTNSILTDRKTGIDQFGLMSNLNAEGRNIALKTGTSREYHDSWVVGYTPDFLVGVWIGNAENTPMDEVSGQVGAGKIWREVMNLMLSSEYNQNTPFSFDLLKEFPDEGNLEYGLPKDDFERQKYLMMDEKLILSPHQEDIFLLEEYTKIFLKSSQEVKWYIDDQLLGEGKEIIFEPEETGRIVIRAEGEENEEEIVIYLE